MTKDEVITHFWEFLFETGAACEYVEAFEADSRYESIDDFAAKLWHLGYLIDEAFEWDKTDIPFSEWLELHNEWASRLNALIYCK